MHACERCYSRKTKCDRRLPRCSSCIKAQVMCQYPNKRRDRQMQKEYLNSLEQRLSEVENENEQLREHASTQAQSAQADNAAQSHQSSPDSLQPASRQYSAESHPLDALHSPSRPVGSLHRTPGEEARYLGSSNGVDFVQVVERVVDSSHSTGGLFGRVAGGGRVSERVTLPSIPQSAVLVNREVAMPLINSYFSHWHLAFPLLYRPAFMQMVHLIYADPQLYRQNCAYAFAFDIVLALGSVPSNRVQFGNGDAESHFFRALTHLDEVSSFQDIRSLQALLLYCKYGIHASLRDTSSELWGVLGKATQLCVQIGLHHNTSTVLPNCNRHVSGQIPISVQVEMQRRCFWCYYNLERIVNISLGRPLALHDDDIDVPLPSSADDDELGLISPDTTQRITPFLQHINLRRIQSKIHRLMYTSRSVQALPLHERQTIRRGIFSELQEWRRNISLLSLPSADKQSEISSSHLNPSWFEALYHSGCLLLFRPSATFPAMEGLESDEDIDDVLQMIWNSSRLILAKYSELLRSRHLNYSWVCLYTIFMAGLANIYAVGCCAQRRKRGIIAFLPPFFDVISDVRECSNILTAICERWDDARDSCDIFNILSMSALKELAATNFQQKGTKATISRSDPCNEQTSIQPASMDAGIIAGQGSTSNSPQLPPHQSYPSPGFPDLAFAQYPDDPLSDPIVDFQQMFQELQNNISVQGHTQTDEVMLGFAQEWFER